MRFTSPKATVSVIDAGTNTFLGTIALGDPRPGVLGALYKKEIDVHGLGFSPDGKLLAAISVTSNAVYTEKLGGMRVSAVKP